MSKASAFQTWFSSFGLTAYEETNVKASAPLPYLTYTYATGDFDGGEVPIVVNIWYRTEATSYRTPRQNRFQPRWTRGVMIP
jgi:hypothetical protein